MSRRIDFTKKDILICDRVTQFGKLNLSGYALFAVLGIEIDKGVIIVVFGLSKRGRIKFNDRTFAEMCKETKK